MMQIEALILLEAAMMKAIYVLHSDPGAGKDKEQCLNCWTRLPDSELRHHLEGEALHPLFLVINLRVLLLSPLP